MGGWGGGGGGTFICSRPANRENSKCRLRVCPLPPSPTHRPSLPPPSPTIHDLVIYSFPFSPFSFNHSQACRIWVDLYTEQFVHNDQTRCIDELLSVNYAVCSLEAKALSARHSLVSVLHSVGSQVRSWLDPGCVGHFVFKSKGGNCTEKV